MEPKGWVKYALSGSGALILFGLTTWVSAVDNRYTELERRDGIRAEQVQEQAERMIRVETKLEGVDDKLKTIDKGQESIQQKLDRLLEK